MEDDVKLDESILVQVDGKTDFSINRTKFYESIVEQVKDYFDGGITVTDLTKDSIQFQVPDDEVMEITRNDLENDLIDPIIKTVVFAILGAKTMIVPKLVFLLDVEDNGDGEWNEGDLVVTDVFCKEFDNVMIGYDPDEAKKAEFSIELSARYLNSLLEAGGLVEYSGEVKLDTFVTDEGEILMDPVDAGKNESITSVADLKLARKAKARNARKLKLKRAKDPAKAKELSRAAKLRWKKYGNKIRRSMAKYYKSSAFKKLVKARDQLGDN